MNFKMMGRFIAQILAIEGIFMIPALLISIFCGDARKIKSGSWVIAALFAAMLLLTH